MKVAPNSTAREMMQARKQLISRLFQVKSLTAAVLAVTLARCSNAAPCRSAACPVCGLAFQRMAVSVVDHFIREPARPLRDRMTAITIIPASGCVAPDELTPETFQEAADEIQSKLAYLGLPPSITGIEASFNEDLTGKVEPHWCVHGHNIQIDWLSKVQKEQLRGVFPPTSRTPRPIRCDELDGNIRGRLYPFKPQRSRRVTYLKTGRATRKAYRATKHRPLRAEQATTLALIDHDVGLAGRLRLRDIDESAVQQHLLGLGWPRDGP